MSKEDMIKEAVEEAKAEAAKMEDEAAARPRSKLSITGRIFSMISFAPISYI